jgi:hypothetical protein
LRYSGSFFLGNSTTKTPDFFRACLDDRIDLKHPLMVLSKRLPWDAVEHALTPHFAQVPAPGLKAWLEMPSAIARSSALKKTSWTRYSRLRWNAQASAKRASRMRLGSTSAWR